MGLKMLNEKSVRIIIISASLLNKILYIITNFKEFEKVEDSISVFIS